MGFSINSLSRGDAADSPQPAAAVAMDAVSRWRTSLLKALELKLEIKRGLDSGGEPDEKTVRAADAAFTDAAEALSLAPNLGPCLFSIAPELLSAWIQEGLLAEGEALLDLIQCKTPD